MGSALTLAGAIFAIVHLQVNPMTFRFSHAQMMAEWMAYRVTAAGAIRLLDFSTAEEFVAAYTMLISEGCTSLKEQMHAIFINQLTQCRCVNNALTRLSTASVCRHAPWPVHSFCRLAQRVARALAGCAKSRAVRR